MIDKKDIETSIHILSGLLGYSERMGSVVNSSQQMYCEEHKECPAKHFRMLYETALKTALEVLITHLDENLHNEKQGVCNMEKDKKQICRRATLEERAKQADCDYCDTARAKDGNFCPRCGKPLKNSEYFT